MKTNDKYNQKLASLSGRAHLARIEHKIDVIDNRTKYLSRVVNNVQNASDAIWGNTRPMLPWYFAAPTALLITLTIINPLRTAGTPISPAIDGAYTYTRYAGEAVGAWFASIQFAQPDMQLGQAIRGLTNQQSAVLITKLRQRESSNNYRIYNRWGYLGAYQFGASALTEIGYMHKHKLDAQPKCVHLGSCGAKHLAYLRDPSNWRAGYSYEAFMSTPSMQDNAFVLLANRNISEGFRRGVLRADNPKRIAGFVAVSHLQGVGTARNYYLHGINTKRGGAYASEYAAIGESAVTINASFN